MLFRSVSQSRYRRPLSTETRPLFVLDRNWSGATNIALEKWRSSLPSPGALLSVFAPFCVLRWTYVYVDIPNQAVVSYILSCFGKFSDSEFQQRAVCSAQFGRLSKDYLPGNLKIAAAINSFTYSAVYELGTREKPPLVYSVITYFQASYGSVNAVFDRTWSQEKWTSLDFANKTPIVFLELVPQQSLEFLCSIVIYLVTLLLQGKDGERNVIKLIGNPALLTGAAPAKEEEKPAA